MWTFKSPTILICEDMSYSDQQIRDAVDAVFKAFDTDNSNSLDANEVQSLINAALKHMNANRQVNADEIAKFIKAVDSSGDGKIQKPELFEIFKKVLNSKWSHTTSNHHHYALYWIMSNPPIPSDLPPERRDLFEWKAHISFDCLGRPQRFW